MDFLSKHHVIIDHGTGQYKFKTHDKSTHDVFITQEVFLPAYTEQIVNVNLDRKYSGNTNTVWLLSSSIKLIERFGIFVANGVFNEQQVNKKNFPIIISNM